MERGEGATKVAALQARAATRVIVSRGEPI
jgi:hypothetical protein